MLGQNNRGAHQEMTFLLSVYPKQVGYKAILISHDNTESLWKSFIKKVMNPSNGVANYDEETKL